MESEYCAITFVFMFFNHLYIFLLEDMLPHLILKTQTN